MTPNLTATITLRASLKELKVVWHVIEDSVQFDGQIGWRMQMISNNNEDFGVKCFKKKMQNVGDPKCRLQSVSDTIINFSLLQQAIAVAVISYF